MKNKYIKAYSFIVVMWKQYGVYKNIINIDNLNSMNEWSYYSNINHRLEVAFIDRDAFRHELNTLTDISLLVGDDYEANISKNDECMGHSSRINIDFVNGSLDVTTSIIGLPPIYIFNDNEKTILTTDVYLYRSIDGFKFEFSPSSVLDLCHVGHTTKGNTIFNNISMVKCGHRITRSARHNLSIYKNWEIPEKENYNLDYVFNSQIDELSRAINSVDIADCFLSLTAGLDTRTILATMINNSKIIGNSYTISGIRPSLDALVAKDLSLHYGIDHQTICLDDFFLKNIEKYILKASWLSGGIYSLSQAHEVFFYENVDKRFKTRLSGNLGNQIGRGGTEGVSMRNADSSILTADFLAGVDKKHISKHWFCDMDDSSGGLGYLSLLQDEVPNSSVGNYCIGNHFVTQKTPYASRALIEISSFKQADKRNTSLSLSRLKFNDIKHRFIGEDEALSFQRKLVKLTGGYVANCPINWGWKANGGVSLLGLVYGVGAIADACVEKKKINNSFIRFLMSSLGLSGLHVYVNSDKWLIKYLEEFTCDIVLSESSSHYFNNKIIESTLIDFFRNRNFDKFNTVCFALDLAIANKLFSTK